MGFIRKLLLILVINMTAVALVASVIPGIQYEGGVRNLFVIAFVFGGVNLLVKPILKALALPIEIATIGIFTVVINAAMLLIVANLVEGFTILSFPFPGLALGSFIVSPITLPVWGTATVGALLIGSIVSILYWLTDAK
jgi:putative membrane protein